MRPIAVPLMVIFGAEDQIYDTDAALQAYSDVPGVRRPKIPGAGHSPNVEKPAQTAALINEFARRRGRRLDRAPTAKRGPQATGRRQAGRG